MGDFIGFLILLSCVALVIYAFSTRPYLMKRKYGLGTHLISLKEDITKEELLELLKNRLTYPGFKSMHFNEAGELNLVGKYGVFSLILEDLTLRVQTAFSLSDRKATLRKEEAICLSKYIEQALYGSSDTNPYKLYRRLRFWNLGKIIFSVGMIVVFLIAVLVNLPSNKIQDSYLNQYSSTITVGEAFDSFFGDPRWEMYTDGSKKVGFQGTCLWGEEKVTVKMIFDYHEYDESFTLVKTTIDGNEALGALLENSILEAAYEEANSQ